MEPIAEPRATVVDFWIEARVRRLEARVSDMAGQITFLRERLKFLEKLLVAERSGHADTKA